MKTEEKNIRTKKKNESEKVYRVKVSIILKKKLNAFDIVLDQQDFYLDNI